MSMSRQAHQGDMDIVLGQGFSLGHQPLDAGAASQKADQGWLADQDDTAAALVDQRGVPDELQRIAQPLLGMDQDGPPVQGGAVPKGWVEGRQRTKFLALPPPFITWPSLLEAAYQEPSQRPIPMSLGIVGLEVEGLLIAGHGLVEPAL